MLIPISIHPGGMPGTSTRLSIRGIEGNAGDTAAALWSSEYENETIKAVYIRYTQSGDHNGMPMLPQPVPSLADSGIPAVKAAPKKLPQTPMKAKLADTSLKPCTKNKNRQGLCGESEVTTESITTEYEPVHEEEWRNNEYEFDVGSLDKQFEQFKVSKEVINDRKIGCTRGGTKCITPMGTLKSYLMHIYDEHDGANMTKQRERFYCNCCGTEAMTDKPFINANGTHKRMCGPGNVTIQTYKEFVYVKKKEKNGECKWIREGVLRKDLDEDEESIEVARSSMNDSFSLFGDLATDELILTEVIDENKAIRSGSTPAVEETIRDAAHLIVPSSFNEDVIANYVDAV